jgi:dimeric dUTPase (all-alpha-NTP-PPase superfamily)
MEKMNLNKLCEMQQILDNRIIKEHGLEGKDLEDNKILALLVELSELANETRCFKHWSKKGPSESSILLEEYVDSLHFFLSIANHRGYDVERLYQNYREYFQLERRDLSLVSAFKDSVEKVVTMGKIIDPYHYIHAFDSYLTLGRLLGFTWGQVEKAYIQKNEINHQRQDNGY